MLNQHLKQMNSVWISLVLSELTLRLFNRLHQQPSDVIVPLD